ncbi:MAG: DUF3137 domain-containing protein [Propionibacteriaceae bacterium]|nr:DUF3137 domain-containing protein [Propionibacteriaceae bacterium]
MRDTVAELGFPFLFLTFILIVTVVVAVFVYQWGQKRRQALLALAAANGWTYTESNYSLTRRWQGAPFGHSDDDATEIFEGYFGENRLPFVAFTYSYTETTHDSKGHPSSTTYYYEVCVVRMPRALPYLSITREGLLTKVARFFGGQDIEFESDDFNRAYHVKSADPRCAYGIIHPQLMEWLLGPGRALTPWRIMGTDLISYESGRIDIARFPNKLHAMTTLIGQIPRHVWDDFGH